MGTQTHPYNPWWKRPFQKEDSAQVKASGEAKRTQHSQGTSGMAQHRDTEEGWEENLEILARESKIPKSNRSLELSSIISRKVTSGVTFL